MTGIRAPIAGAGVIMVLGLVPAAAVSDYGACMDLVAERPERAEAEAAGWAAAGGGPAARHCRAVALAAMGRERLAAEALVALAADATAMPDTARADLLLQAGELFLELGDIDAAAVASERVFALAGATAAALEFRARIRAERRDWAGAEADLDRAIAAAAPSADLLILRASARRRRGRLVEARDDANWALDLAPERADLWLELGTIHAGLGDRAAARAAWLETVRLDRDGALAELARRRMQRMELAPE